uniref:Uncharacterized protein n=1 Tax=Oryza punctata TaxID=4537 RepID=A0A0E0LJH6_ORYPU
MVDQWCQTNWQSIADHRHHHGSLISSDNATPPPPARSSSIVPPLLAATIPITDALHQDRASSKVIRLLSIQVC